MHTLLLFFKIVFQHLNQEFDLGAETRKPQKAQVLCITYNSYLITN